MRPDLFIMEETALFGNPFLLGLEWEAKRVRKAFCCIIGSLYHKKREELDPDLIFFKNSFFASAF